MFPRGLFAFSAVFDEEAIMADYNVIVDHSVFDEEAIMADLPSHTRGEVVRSMYKDMIDNSMFFDGGEQYNDTAVMKICMKLQSTAALEGDQIYSECDIGEDMFFVREGSVHMVRYPIYRFSTALRLLSD